MKQWLLALIPLAILVVSFGVFILSAYYFPFKYAFLLPYIGAVGAVISGVECGKRLSNVGVDKRHQL